MGQHGHRDHQGDQPRAVVGDLLGHVLAEAGSQTLAKMTEHVLQHVGVPPPAGLAAQGRHEDAAVFLLHRLGRPVGRPRHQASQGSITPLVVGQQQHLLGGVETHQIATAPAWDEEALQSTEGEDPLEEVLAQRGVAEPSLLLQGKIGNPLHQGPSEEADPVLLGHSFRRVEANPLHAAGGRPLLEDEPAQAQSPQLLDPPAAEALHVLGPVAPGPVALHVDPVGTANQSDRLAGNSHADLQLGADRDEVDESGDGSGQEGLALMPSVEAHLQTGQARGNTHENRLVIHPEGFHAGTRFSPGAESMDRLPGPVKSSASGRPGRPSRPPSRSGRSPRRCPAPRPARASRVAWPGWSGRRWRR